MRYYEFRPFLSKVLWAIGWRQLELFPAEAPDGYADKQHTPRRQAKLSLLSLLARPMLQPRSRRGISEIPQAHRAPGGFLK